MAGPIHVTECAYLDPVAAFTPFAAEPFALLFDSALKDPDHGRYAFIAADPFLKLVAKDGEIRLGDRCFSGDPFVALGEELARYPQPSLRNVPPFQGGAAGFFGYDLCHHLEKLPAPPPESDGVAFPDMALGFYDVVAAFDLWQQRAWIISTGHPERDPGRRAARAAGRARAFRARLEGAPSPKPPAVIGFPVSWESNFTRESYQACVARVVDYIWAGDIFQANLSQRFLARLPDHFDPFALYCRLRAVNPAPFAAYLNFGDMVLASSSPERFLRVRGDRVETRPVKGTRPRGMVPAEDAALAEALRESAKDRSENVMIVDLLRNDLSRVCRDHSIHVPELCVLESFATVHHLVSTVTGRLREGMTAVDLLRAAFPGGSITGAPKVRAMEIIAELEPTRRGPYCGCIGYLGFDGAMDTNIAIRTLAFKDRTAVFQAGGGIVADSDPALEYGETLDKAKALFACFEAPAADLAV
ncbi:MAG: aminodeoxychorismate synthase component I [Alphaproteobacteria bacterium]|nr:aminodeoxychorismate synthase component I [Alphaproteobacteria bacterium]